MRLLIGSLRLTMWFRLILYIYIYVRETLLRLFYLLSMDEIGSKWYRKALATRVVEGKKKKKNEEKVKAKEKKIVHFHIVRWRRTYLNVPYILTHKYLDIYMYLYECICGIRFFFFLVLYFVHRFFLFWNPPTSTRTCSRLIFAYSPEEYVIRPLGLCTFRYRMESELDILRG